MKGGPGGEAHRRGELDTGRRDGEIGAGDTDGEDTLFVVHLPLHARELLNTRRIELGIRRQALAHTPPPQHGYEHERCPHARDHALFHRATSFSDGARIGSVPPQ